MLLCRSLAVEGIERRHLELGWVLDRVPFHWIWSGSPCFLADTSGFQGSDLFFESLHPLNCIVANNLRIRLWFVLVVSFAARVSLFILTMRRMEANEAV